MNVTSREIMDSLGIKNVKTLTRWYQAGIIPEPTIEVHPDGNGRMAYWQSWVLDHCRVIKQMTENGQTIKEIAGTFGKNWQAIAARYRKYNFARASAAKEYEKIANDIREAIHEIIAMHLGGIRRSLEMTSFPPVALDVVSQAIDLIEKGQNPVLILSSKKIVAVPDFLLSLHLSKNYLDRHPFLVVPLFSILTQQAGTALPPKPSIQPVNMISKNEKTSSRDFIYMGTDWEFKVERKRKTST
jgi:hypothetical protein